MPPHVLLAEDNLALNEIMREILEAEGYRVTATNNGREALRAFDQETPDIILSDVHMPYMDGFALLEAVRSRPQGVAVPFMLLSARTEPSTTSQARLLGADDYLFKPFSPGELSLAVRAKLDRRRAVERFDTRTAHMQTVLLLANVIEARDEYTRGHTERVQRYALTLAEALNWNPAALAVVEFGALLHDIGKIVVPREILNKSTQFLPAEWAIMRRHPEIGAQMLAGVDHLQPAIPYILHHHERWDGRGYPAGLSGERIPPQGRMLAIVDTYDAMTTTRAYRQAIPRETALAEIRKQAGSQFDPEMTEVFLELAAEGRIG